jgi:cytochrome c oxidase subunit II
MIDTREEFGDLLRVFLPITAVVFAVIALLVLGIVVLSRRRRQDPGWRSAWPKAEAAYALVLLAFVVVLLAFTFRTESRVDEVAPKPGLELDVTGFQWQWSFRYPGGFTVNGARDRPAQLVVPKDTTIRFRVTSRDVVHSFWIPHLRFKRDAFPGYVNEFDLVFPESGRFDGRCAEFCGLRHAYMTFEVIVLPPEQFAAWLKERSA